MALSPLSVSRAENLSAPQVPVPIACCALGAFNTYGLRTSIDPITGLGTSAGTGAEPGLSGADYYGDSFVVYGVSYGNPTFTATLQKPDSPVPEPSSLALFASTLACCGFLLFRSSRTEI